jgi:hypothetical protein
VIVGVDPAKVVAHELASGLSDRVSANGNAPEVEGSAEDSWLPIDLSAVAEREPASPTILPAAEDGRGLLYEGKRHLVTGRPEAAKSWLGLAACLDVIRRLGRVAVFVDFDLMGAHEAKARMSALGAQPAEMERFWYVEPDRPFDDRAAAWWGTQLAAEAVGLVWLDAQNPGLELHGLKPNADDDVARFQRLIVGRFHRAGAATAVSTTCPRTRTPRPSTRSTRSASSPGWTYTCAWSSTDSRSSGAGCRRRCWCA